MQSQVRFQTGPQGECGTAFLTFVVSDLGVGDLVALFVLLEGECFGAI